MSKIQECKDCKGKDACYCDVVNDKPFTLADVTCLLCDHDPILEGKMPPKPAEGRTVLTTYCGKCLVRLKAVWVPYE